MNTNQSPNETIPKDPEKEKRKIKSVKTMKKIMTDYYIQAKTASQNGKLVAWITSGGPVEPLIAFDVIPVYPENYGAMIGASKMGVDLCEKAEEMGYSRDLCSYARSDIACATVDGGPIGGLPKPDFLVCCNNICGTVMKWYEVQARYFNVPLFIYDTPFIHTEFSPEAHRYLRRQLDDYIAFLEKVTGKKADMDKFSQVGRLSLEGQKLWQAVLDTTMHRPAPMTAFDAFFHLALIVTLRGTQTVVDYYTELLNEMRERVSQGIGMVPDEKYRLIWDNLPVWYRTKWLSDKLASHGAALVSDTYTSAWSGVMHLIDPDNFMETMGLAYSHAYINTSVDMMFEKVKEMVVKYGADGLVMHSNRSCKPYSFGQYDLQKMVLKELDIPTLIIEADMVDERNFSESQIETRIDAFMEILKGRK
ncbi:MAG: 2-hydroxyglutaryl-CoA dehydratase [Spirochaetae bacterium HGW-Spirochaetae-1]|jgi:benzoyl-CoA reductase/2-hydroxyglutaryl-CoA dehydratase subunit BcrC/BadD/HgdB|nr:MAG: 2-hydroxyglutaryl-CoA dehydratase [Spirochaetae bacterium HGW-Spirochaetae-1]